MEIVGREQRLMYGTDEEAVQKIVRVMNSSDEQSSLRDHLSSRKELFSAETFMRRIREIVREF